MFLKRIKRIDFGYKFVHVCCLVIVRHVQSGNTNRLHCPHMDLFQKYQKLYTIKPVLYFPNMIPYPGNAIIFEAQQLLQYNVASIFIKFDCQICVPYQKCDLF